MLPFFAQNMHWTDLSTEKFDQAALNALPTKERKRFEAVWELFHTEVTYITDHLLVLKEVISKVNSSFLNFLSM